MMRLLSSALRLSCVKKCLRILYVNTQELANKLDVPYSADIGSSAAAGSE